MIRVEHLTKQFGPIEAISDLSFSVQQGEILGFLGPNGAGKTTTLRILSGIFPPTQGKAEVAGFNVNENPLEVRKRIGYLPEQVPLYPELTVTEYLDFVVSIWNFTAKDRRNRIREVLDQCGLTEVSDGRLGRLSRGFRQRVGLAQALVHDPDVLILDEPTVGLDPKQIHEIRDLIKSFKGKKTVILSTHILPEVSVTCDRVIIIDRGKVVAQGTTESLTEGRASELEIEVAGPTHEVIQQLQSISGVTQVKSLNSNAARSEKFLIQMDKNRDVRSEIAKAIVVKNWGLLEMKLHTLTLEDIFLKLVTHEEPL